MLNANEKEPSGVHADGSWGEAGKLCLADQFAEATSPGLAALSFRSSRPLGMIRMGWGWVDWVEGCVAGQPCAGIISSVPGRGAWAGITATRLGRMMAEPIRSRLRK